MKWDTRPHRINSRRRVNNDHIAFAVTSPPEDSARIFDRCASSNSTDEIELLNRGKIDKKAGWTGMRTYQPPQINEVSAARERPRASRFEPAEDQLYDYGSRDADD